MFMNLILLRLVIPAFQIQQQQFLDQEKIRLDYIFYQMAINNQNDEQNFLNLNLQLLQKVQEFDTYSNLYQNYSILNRNNNETLLLVNEKSQLKALLSFTNFLINDKLFVTISNFSIQLPQENCEQVYFLQDDHLLVICKENGNSLQIFIINKLQILDQKQLTYEFKCEIGFSKIDQMLIIYEKNCFDIFVYKIEIDLENYKLNIQYFSELMTKLIEVQNQFSQRLIQLEICQNEQFYIAFQQMVLYYSNQIQLLSPNYKVKRENLEIYKLFNCCKNPYITQINKKTGTLIFKNKYNISTQGYRQSYFSPYFILHHFDDKVVVQLSEKLQFQLHSEFFQFFQISDMLYFVSVESNGKLSIFELQNGNIYLKEMKSEKIGIYKILNLTSVIMKVEPFDIHKLQLKIAPKTTQIIQQKFDIQIRINLSEIQETLPLTLFSIEQNGEEIGFDEGFEGFHEANIKDESIKNVWFLNLGSNQNIFIQEFQTSILIKMFLEQKLIKEFNILIQSKYILTLVNAFSQSIIIIYDYFIEIYKIENFQIINWVSYYTDEIIIANIYENSIWILFQSCILHQVDISKSLNQKTFHNFKLHKSCRLNSLYSINLIIQDQEIYYKPNNKITYQLKFESRIIDFIMTKFQDTQFNSYFLTLIQEEQGIKISLYIIDIQNLVHLYDLPFYQYKPIQPLNYKLQTQFFMIVVQDDSDEKCLLIYNIKNIGKKSLIKIIKLNKEQIVYNFIEDQDSIIYFKDGKIRFNKIQEINIKLNYFDLINNNMDFYTIKNLNIKFTSLIKSLNQYVYMPLKILHLNTIQNLAIINNQVQLISQNGYLNLSNIYGSIDKIEVIQKNGFIEMNPVNYTWNRIECIFYNNNVCQISKERFMINYFSKGQNIYTQQLIQNVQSVIYDKKQSKYIFICFSMFTYIYRNQQCQNNQNLDIGIEF
ncbi:unnamed protein product [Paramecium octaurelia]|uniref:Transmembrane protein n=1 Tax=Paramecium octaurelia TaxID=43137 RepID=A0A8S1WYI3_PAROT|nr:unnamed protein product [Paramecium octaurelia]